MSYNLYEFFTFLINQFNKIRIFNYITVKIYYIESISLNVKKSIFSMAYFLLFTMFKIRKIIL